MKKINKEIAIKLVPYRGMEGVYTTTSDNYAGEDADFSTIIKSSPVHSKRARKKSRPISTWEVLNTE